MTQEHIALLVDEAGLTLEELAVSCTVSREWIIEHVRAGVLPCEGESDPERWTFGSRDLLRVRRIYGIERSFDANPELAGLVADMMEEIATLRRRLR